MKNEIVFTPFNKGSSLMKTHPTPSKKHIPDWYRSISPFWGRSNNLDFYAFESAPNITVKRCMPFLDALTDGYTITLETDVFVSTGDYNLPVFKWHPIPDYDLVGTHAEQQIEGFPVPTEFINFPYKWNYHWSIKVPKGYSVLFYHPHNRLELPFHTLSGLVDCDSQEAPVQFPFLLKKNFEGVIPKGTPLVQFSIIKRENWKSKIADKVDDDEAYIIFRKTRSLIQDVYKTLFWHRKNYD